MKNNCPTEMPLGTKLNIQHSTWQSFKIAIAGTGYVGLSNGLLLAQYNEVVALASPDPLTLSKKVGIFKVHK